MSKVTIVIPNWNGKHFLEDCLPSLEAQTFRDFSVILIDNGSEDGSVEYVRSAFPWIRIRRFHKNTGFCHAVNTGIALNTSPYIVLLNNDTACEPDFLEKLLAGIERHPDAFSCQALLVSKTRPELLDDAGDFYCALGWAFADGKGRPRDYCTRERQIFSSCAAAAIYRSSVLDQIGNFDERHFAYLEDLDICYRARIAGYSNWLIPDSVVYHVGSATSGSAYNEFKIRNSSRNNIYLIHKNMPLPQILLNLPLLAAGFAVKTAFFARRGFLKEYLTGLVRGFRMSDGSRKVRFRGRDIVNYMKIQWELWVNIFRRCR